MRTVTIYIPSMSRAEVFKKNTMHAIPMVWRRCAHLLVPESQVDEYARMLYPEWRATHVIGVPDNLKGIGKTRQYGIDNSDSKFVFFLDDDLRICTRKKIEENYAKTSLATEFEVYSCFETLLAWLEEDNIGQVAIGSAWRCHDKPSFTENQMCGMATIVNRKLLEKHDIRYDTIPMVLEDVYVCLKLLTLGYKNRVTFDWVIRNIPANSSGGCSEYRTKESINSHAEKMSELFPGLVTKYIRPHEWQGLGSGVPNIRVHWKKAYKEAMRNL